MDNNYLKEMASVEAVRKNQFNIKFPSEIGIQDIEVKSVSFGSDRIDMRFKCLAQGRALKTLVELNREISVFDFEVELMDNTGNVVSKVPYYNYAVEQLNYELDYSQNDDIEVYVILKQNGYRAEYRTRYTLDNGVKFGGEVESADRKEIEARIKERVSAQKHFIYMPQSSLGHMYKTAYEYNNYGMSLLQSKLAQFLDSDRKVFAYRKSRQVGSTHMTIDLAELYVELGKRVCVFVDEKNRGEYKYLAGDNVLLAKSLLDIRGHKPFDLVLFTENHVFNTTSTDVQYEYGIVETQLSKNGKAVFELPPRIHVFDSDDNYLPWWLDDKKINGDLVDLYKEGQRIESSLTPDECVKIYERNKELFKTHQAMFVNQWRTDMEHSLGDTSFRGLYGSGRFRTEFEV